ncbi:ethanolamine utilization protein EutN/carboxysome structural protein Ccml [[Clostridium] methylpentosum DSM 5476]|uniref:Ethanolamine utilization protein EutN/carboxysome structural protein Ccml n=1 Tax=[Clostridium] methylpentosum DSM 5476 TaxID=537013 RepID=C0E8A6_9FIRM|nr:ethanolamine utilization protein EutN/carboxysome structural protein Ccml [[Clostridium] methylpentosum DSM 5476]
MENCTMYMGKVVGNIVSTRKHESLVGSKILEIKIINNGVETDEMLIAIDNIGAGIGDRVLVTTGSGARLALNNPKTAVDAVVVGIIDE